MYAQTPITQADDTFTFRAKQSTLKTVPQFCDCNPAFTVGGIRHIQFTLGDELTKAGAVVRFGRKLLIDEEKFLDFVRSGKAAKIAGGKS
jgi:hypothetical protein